jgi:hypothetical protein
MAGIEWSRMLEPPIGAILAGGLVGVVNFVVIGYFWVRSREIRLKERMVQRGFSLAEIERVLLVTTLNQKRRPSTYMPQSQPTTDTG